jgi:predicted RNA-binding protein with EMAP domain
MNKYLYELTHFAGDNEIVIKTNDIRFLLDTMLGIAGMGDHIEVIDGFTGEVLAVMNHPEPYMQDAFSLMVLGRQMERLGLTL